MFTFIYYLLESLIITTLNTFLSLGFGSFSYSYEHLSQLPKDEYLNQINETGRNLKFLITGKSLPKVQTSRTAEEYSFPYDTSINNIDNITFRWPKSNVSGYSSDDSDFGNDTPGGNYLTGQNIAKEIAVSCKNIKTKFSKSTSDENCTQQDIQILEQLRYNSNLCKSLTHEDTVLPEEYQSDFQRNFMKTEGMKHRLPMAENYMKAALTSRIIVFGIQYLSYNLLPHHNNDGFRFSPEENYGKYFDTIINSTFSGLANWDGQYFLHIANKGYTDENFMAFFPLFPASVYFISMIFHVVASPLVSFSSVTLVVGIVLNCILFIVSAELLRDITKRCDRGLDNLSQFVILLYCYNPASIFFSAFYTESMFSFLTMSMLHSLLNRNMSRAVIMGALSSLCRSNGILNFCLIAAFIVRNALCNVRQPDFNYYVRAGVEIVTGFVMIGIGVIPFALFQIFGIRRFCDGVEIPPQLPEYCINHFVLPYQYVQKNYWNVGFLNYFEPQQIPNFLLALPVLLVTLYECVKRFRIYFWYVVDNKFYDCIGDLSMTVHGIFLTLFCFFCIHVQVSTRLILSACPYLYVYIAKSHRTEVIQYRQQKLDFPIFSSSIYGWAFFYYIVGTVMFSVGLPWT